MKRWWHPLGPRSTTGPSLQEAIEKAAEKKKGHPGWYEVQIHARTENPIVEYDIKLIGPDTGPPPP